MVQNHLYLLQTATVGPQIQGLLEVLLIILRVHMVLGIIAIIVIELLVVYKKSLLRIVPI
jgi:hypothetical protein